MPTQAPDGAPDFRGSKRRLEPPSRLPPSSPESEQAVLGCCMLDNSCIGRVIEAFKGSLEAIYDLRNRSILEMMVSMYEDRDAIDVITLQDRLKAFGLLEQVGGIGYLSSLPDTTPSAANIDYYIAILRDCYLRRRMIATATNVVSQMYDLPAGDLEEALDMAERSILQVSESRVEQKQETIRTIVTTAMAEIEQSLQNRGQPSGMSTGFTDFDRMTDGFHAGEMIVIAARPSVGKTSLAMNIAEFVAVSQRIPVGIFSLEMTKTELVKRMVCSRARVNARTLRDGYASDLDFPKLTTAAGQIMASPMYIDDEGGVSILQLRAKARRMWQQYNIKLFVIDYLQLLHGIKAESRQLEVSQVSNGIKNLAKELGVPILVAAQLNRDIEKEKNRRPRLSDLRESGCLSCKTTNLFTLDGVQCNMASRMNTYSLSKAGKIVIRDSKNITQPDKPMIRLVLRSGRFLDCTASHPILTDRGFVSASEITAEHSVACVRQIPEPKGTIPIPEAKWIGWMLGNGTMLGYSSPGFITGSEATAEAFKAETRRLFGLDPRPHKHWSGAFQYDITAGPVRTPRGNPCKDWLIQHDLWGRHSWEKTIPDWFISQADNASIAALISGLWETDGTVTGNTLKYSTTSNQLAWQIVWCFTRLGIFPFLNEGYMSKRAKHPCFTISIADGRHVEMFRRLIPMIGPKADKLREASLSVRGSNHGDRLGKWVGTEISRAMEKDGIGWRELGYRPQNKRISQEDFGKLLPRLKSLKPLARLVNPAIYWDRFEKNLRIDDGAVFDREVRNGPHNFVANGIIVHNSIENDSDVVSFLYVPGKNDSEEDPNADALPVTWMIGKSRNGPTGTINLIFRRSLTRFELAAKVSDEDVPEPQQQEFKQ